MFRAIRPLLPTCNKNPPNFYCTVWIGCISLEAGHGKPTPYLLQLFYALTSGLSGAAVARVSGWKDK